MKDTYYIGSSEDPVRRLGYYNSVSKGHTQKYRPWKLVYSMEFATKVETLIAERKVKSWKSKKMVRRLIDEQIDIRDYL